MTPRRSLQVGARSKEREQRLSIASAGVSGSKAHAVLENDCRDESKSCSDARGALCAKGEQLVGAFIGGRGAKLNTYSSDVFDMAPAINQTPVIERSAERNDASERKYRKCHTPDWSHAC